ncbi:pentapeptide repeat-containing protein [Bradyrhizobium iriomotense]|uniref:Pentapeptide repeat-containing protein n=1 Tax=Bradyrhizobium iriomotense TaxID=441950 RepID=A0ABQ6BBN3_9BRAD|nr:pentapeptide repeat-containing protein [Bradyrhizobium iriomotense]GLR90901.1 hypothetical protein GCM10007857_76170 [Bradyrhizobium iriomotense]
MANDQHLALLYKGVSAWNTWRKENVNIRPDLARADLTGVVLPGANLRGVNFNATTLIRAELAGADLTGVDLDAADLTGANLSEADLCKAKLSGADLSGANLSKAKLSEATLRLARLCGANLCGADLSRTRMALADFRKADLRGANLSSADLFPANLDGADLRGANLNGADLREAHLVEAKLNGAWLETAVLVDTDLSGADLTGCMIYGISAWGLKLEGTKQQNLVIAPDDEPTITVDNIEVAQFIYLMLSNQKIRDVIDTITSKVVLILGRFTNERMDVLNALREELRKRDYLPILYDFDKPRARDTDETITLLARMARFVIADVSDAKSVLHELRAIVPDLPSVPVQPIILATQEEPGMFDFYQRRPTFLTIHRYTDQKQLIADLADKVIRPAEIKVQEFRGRSS